MNAGADVAMLADRLAEADAAPVAPLSEKYPQLSVEDAYEIRIYNIRAREREGGIVRGHKIGSTARTAQEMLGVSEPDHGHSMDDMFVAESEPISMSSLCAPRVESEFAFDLNTPLWGPGVTTADVLRATAFVMPSLEIINSRIANWQIKLAVCGHECDRDVRPSRQPSPARRGVERAT